MRGSYRWQWAAYTWWDPAASDLTLHALDCGVVAYAQNGGRGNSIVVGTMRDVMAALAEDYVQQGIGVIPAVHLCLIGSKPSTTRPDPSWFPSFEVGQLV